MSPRDSSTVTSKVIRKIPDHFMESLACKSTLDSLQDALLNHSTAELGVVYDKFCSIIFDELTVKKIRPGGKCIKPWWTPELSLLRKNLRGTLQNWQASKQDKSLKARYTQAQKAFDQAVRWAKRQFIHQQQYSLANSLKSNPKFFWKRWDAISIQNCDKSCTLPKSVIDSKGDEITGQLQVRKCWQEYFSSLLSTDDTLAGPSSRFEFLPPFVPVNSDILNSNITLEEVRTAIHHLSTKKSPGHDKIRAEYIKNEQCIHFLHTFFNTCFNSGKIPLQWSKSIIKPIPKCGGSSKNPGDYRGISIQSIALKTFCSILGNRLADFVETHELLVDEQNGFRKDRNCLDHIFTLYSTTQARLSENRDTFVCYVDLKKAFDNVNRVDLWYKLEQLFGLDGKFLKVLKGMYAEVLSCVQVNDNITDWFSVEKGVKQGCILSPMLFSMFINDLAHYINSLGTGIVCGEVRLAILLFADDIALMAESEVELQKLLDGLSAWCFKWNCQINPTKTQVMHFRKKHRSRSTYQFTCGPHNLQYTSEYKYLGFWINEHLDLNKSIEHTACAAKKAVGILIAKSRNSGGFTFDVYFHLFQTLVLPIINYTAAIWGHREYSCIQQIQNQAMRAFLGVGRVAPICALQGDLGWAPMVVYTKCEVVKLWHRLCSLPSSRISSKIFRWLGNRRRKNWVQSTRHLMQNVELPLHAINCTSRKAIGDQAWEAFASHHGLGWKNRVWDPKAVETTSGGRLSLYRVLKPSPGTEPYVAANVQYAARRVMAGLRMGCLPLEVERGRYTQTPYERRTCKLCLMDVEDQRHFLLFCPALQQERNLLFNSLHAGGHFSGPIIES